MPQYDDPPSLRWETDGPITQPLPGFNFTPVSAAASPHGFRIAYRIDPEISDMWSPVAETTDDLGNRWPFMGGAYGTERDAEGLYTDGVLTAGPAEPQRGRTYRVSISHRTVTFTVLIVRHAIDPRLWVT